MKSSQAIMPKYTDAQAALKKGYQNRQDSNVQTKLDWQKKAFGWSIFRLIYFFVAAGLLILVFNYDIFIGTIATILALLLFGFLIRRHLQMQARARYHELFAKVNEEEINIFDFNFQHRSNGQRFFEMDHLYAQDLDIFGNHSFFQYANRASTGLGEKALADWLSMVAHTEEIGERQVAVQDLAGQLEWRQRLQALGGEIGDSDKDSRLLDLWLSSPNFLLDKWYVPIFLILAPIWFVVTTILCFTVLTPFFLIIAWGMPLFILSLFVTCINEVHRITSKAGSILKQYSHLIDHIETGKFSAPLLLRLQSEMKGQDITASKTVRQLGYIIHQLDARNNAFVMVLNVIGLWDMYWVRRLEQWKLAHKEDLPKWFDRMADFEALMSLGTLAYNHPHWSFPQIAEAGAELEAKQLAHPLIPANEVISNEIIMPTQAHLKLLTGSNMAGKSTFLRTLGLNITLAMSGAPVCAAAFKLPRLQVMTSMRTQDALHESTSSFYAELKRLKIIIESVERLRNAPELPQAFFLLDEILKGTNSRDRHAGSRALIEQLIKEKGAGIIATHDLELGVLEENANGAVENLCIEVQVKDGELYFDYKLKKGLSKSFNATQLMKNMGIKIEA